jgi:ribosome maturation factor RimP
MMPLLEAEFPGRGLHVEVSTPGINREAKDGAELAHYKGRGVRVWRTDISGWSAGVLETADEQGITINGKGESIRLCYDVIAKARLDPQQEEYFGH